MPKLSLAEAFAPVSDPSNNSASPAVTSPAAAAQTVAPPIEIPAGSQSVTASAPDPTNSSPDLTVTPAPSGPRKLSLAEAWSTPDPSTSTDSANVSDPSKPTGPLTRTEDDGWLSGAAKGLGTAGVKAVYGAIALPKTIDQLMAAGTGGIEHLITGKPYAQVMADRDKAVKDSGAPDFAWPSYDELSKPLLSKTGEYDPETTAGKAAQVGVEAVLGSMLPGGGIGAGAAGAPVKALATGLAKQAPANFASGYGAELAQENAPDGYKTAAGLLGGVLAPAGIEGAAKIANSAGSLGREAAIARDIDNAGTDAVANRAALQDPSLVPNVPGFQPSVGEITGDKNLLIKQRLAENQPGYTLQADRDAQNNAAIKSQIDSASGTDPIDRMAPTNYLDQKLTDTDRQTQAEIDQANFGARSSVPDALNQPQSRPEVGGANIRTAVQNTDDAQRANIDDLYKAAKGDGIVQDVTGIKAAAAKIKSDHDDIFHGPMSSAENHLYDSAPRMDDTIPYENLIAYDTRINTAMREARKSGDVNAVNRLKQLKAASMDALSGEVPEAASVTKPPESSPNTEVSSQPAAEPPPFNVRGERPVAPTEPRPRDLIQAIRDHGGMQDPTGDLKDMGLDDIKGFIAKPGTGLHPDKMREAMAEQGYLGADIDHAMANTTTGDLLDNVASMEPVYSVRDQELAARWKAHDENKAQWDNGRGEPVNRPATQPRSFAPIDSYTQADMYPAGEAPAAKEPLTGNSPDPEKIQAAKAAHIERQQKLNGPIGDILKDDGYKGDYSVMNSAVPGKAVPPGDKGYEVAKAFIKESGGGALDAMKDHILNPLRAKIVDGTLSKKAVDDFKLKYGPALRAIDEHSPGFTASLDGAGRAHDVIAQATAMRNMQMDSLQKGAAKVLLGKSTESEARAEIGKILSDKSNGPSKIRDLMNQVKDNPEAVKGIQKLATDWITDNFVTAGKDAAGQANLSEKLTKFLNGNQAIKRVLPKEGYEMLQAAKRAQDMAQLRFSVDAKKTSQTSKSLLGHIAEGKHNSLIGMISTGGVGLIGEHLITHGGLSPENIATFMGAGGAALIGKKFINESNLRKKMVQEALMDPERAKALQERFEYDNPRAWKKLARTIQRQATVQNQLNNN